MNEKKVICCDWGTSNFRLYLVEQQGNILGQVEAKLGVKTVFQEWQQAQMPDRIPFYQSVLQKQILRLQEATKTHLEKTPILLSGMATSSIGMIELPYAQLPQNLDNPSLVTKYLPASDTFPYPTFMISGVASDKDVMRGEETQAIGWFHHLMPRRKGKVLVILPGTHSKHLSLDDGTLKGFNTYMTGEFFALLKDHSILRNTIAPDGPTVGVSDPSAKRAAFRKGVIDAQSGMLTNLAFHLRAQSLVGEILPDQGSEYLSGLLIGHELKQLPQHIPIVVAGNETFSQSYKIALETLGRNSDVDFIDAEMTDQLAIQGQLAIHRILGASLGLLWQ